MQGTSTFATIDYATCIRFIVYVNVWLTCCVFKSSKKKRIKYNCLRTISLFVSVQFSWVARVFRLLYRVETTHIKTNHMDSVTLVFKCLLRHWTVRWTAAVDYYKFFSSPRFIYTYFKIIACNQYVAIWWVHHRDWPFHRSQSIVYRLSHSRNWDHITSQIVTNRMECQCYAVNAKRIPNSVLTRFNTAILRHLLFGHCCFVVVSSSSSSPFFFRELKLLFAFDHLSFTIIIGRHSHRSPLMVRNSQSRKINGLFTPESTIYRDVLDFLTWEKLLSQVWLGGCVVAS